MLVLIKKHPAASISVLGVFSTFVILCFKYLGSDNPFYFKNRPGLPLRAALVTIGIGLAWDLLFGPRDVFTWVRSHAVNWKNLLQMLAITGQIAVLLLVARQFSLENGAFYQTIMPLCLFGFLLHYFVPDELKLPTFLLISLVGFAAVLGTRNASILVVIGLGLIGLASLPVPYWWRVAAVLTAGTGLALMRNGLVKSPFPDPIWPILGAVFMFRLIIYILETRRGKNLPGFLETLSYFFLLPNVVFPLFPVIDLSVFRNSRFSTDAMRIYQRGVDWILRGFFHLLLYRIINYYFIVPTAEIKTIADIWLSIVATYALYLRVSGQFHVIVGILHLFGFRLPETHYLYFLSTDFGEIWRRMNIYWKEFIQKTFFYPSYFKFKSLGEAKGLAIATILSFLATWFLHAYQWFWLRGDFLFTWPDLLFWTFLAVLVLRKNLMDSKKPRSAYLTKPVVTPKLVIKRTLNASAVFFTMCLLWSFWNAISIGEWLGTWRVAEVTPRSLLMVIVGTAAIVLAIGIGIWFELRIPKPGILTRSPIPTNQFILRTSQTVLLGAFLFMLGSPNLITRSPQNVKTFLGEIRVTQLSDRDRQLMERGYYENLIGVDRFNPDLWSLYSTRPVDWVDLEETDAVILTPNSFVDYELRPNFETIFHNAFLTTNQWGMRDKDYALEKRDDVYRIAIIGSSRTMGSGIEQEHIFKTLVENQLNEQFAGKRMERYEILNFSVSGYTLLHNLTRIDPILAFHPDMVILEINPSFELTYSFRYLASRLHAGIPAPYPFLEDLLIRANVDARTPEAVTLANLMPYGEEFFDWAFGMLADRITAGSAVPVLLNYPSVVPEDKTEDIGVLFASAKAAGFKIISLDEVFLGYDPNELMVAPWDYHPNTEAHHLLAEALFSALMEMGLVPIP